MLQTALLSIRIKVLTFYVIYLFIFVLMLINREICTMVYKSLNELAPENLGNIFFKLSDVHSKVLRDTKCNLGSATDENCLWPKNNLRFMERRDGMNSTWK